MSPSDQERITKESFPVSGFEIIHIGNNKYKVVRKNGNGDIDAHIHGEFSLEKASRVLVEKEYFYNSSIELDIFFITYSLSINPKKTITLELKGDDAVKNCLIGLVSVKQSLGCDIHLKLERADEDWITYPVTDFDDTTNQEQLIQNIQDSNVISITEIGNV